MFAFLFLLLTAVVCFPAYAGLPPSTPELDAGTLGALTSGITGAYFAYRLYRLKSKR